MPLSRFYYLILLLYLPTFISPSQQPKCYTVTSPTNQPLTYCLQQYNNNQFYLSSCHSYISSTSDNKSQSDDDKDQDHKHQKTTLSETQCMQALCPDQIFSDFAVCHSALHQGQDQRDYMATVMMMLLIVALCILSMVVIVWGCKKYVCVIRDDGFQRCTACAKYRGQNVSDENTEGVVSNEGNCYGLGQKESQFQLNQKFKSLSKSTDVI